MDLENYKKLVTIAGSGLALFIGYKIFFANGKSGKNNVLDEVSEETKLNLPKLGDGTELEDYGKALITFGERCERHGKGAGYVDVFGTKTILLTNPEIVRKVLGHTVQHALWGGLTAASEAFFGKNVLFVLEGQQWRFLRAVIKHSLLLQNVKLMTRDVALTAHEFSKKLQVNVSLDFNQLMGLYHLAAIGKSAFNYDLNCLAKDELGPNAISESFEFFIDELPRRALNPDQTIDGDYISDSEQNRKWKKASQTVRNTITKVVEERLTELKLNPKSSIFSFKSFVTVKVGKDRVETRKDLLNAMIFSNLEEIVKVGTESKTDEVRNEIQVTKNQIEQVVEAITDNLVETLFAGYNTNVGTIANALHFLAMHPRYQEECRKEIDIFFTKHRMSIFDPDKFTEVFDFNNFKKVENLFYETLRLRPPAPMLARLLSKDFKFNINGEDVMLPKSHPVWIPAEFLHTNSKYWYKYDAQKFNPDRFNLDKPCQTGSFVPFSGGPRDCIGKNFAKLEAVLVLVMILKDYIIETDPNYSFKNGFNGFGYRPVNAKNGKVEMNLIAKKRS